MTRTNGRTRRLPLAVLCLAIAMVATACGGAAAPPVSAPATITPVSARPIAKPTPSPSAGDVSAAFVKTMASTFSGTAVLTGSMKVGTIDGDISGDAAFDGADTTMDMTISAGTFKQETATITVGGKSWTRKSPGPWLVAPKKPAGSKSNSLSDILKTAANVTDAGVVSKGGESLHHMKLKGAQAIGAEAFGLDVKGTKDATFSLDFYATDTGAPAIMAMAGTWTQVVGATEIPMSMTFDMAFANIGKPQTIKAPKDVWTVYTSKKFGYSMAHPADWTVKSEEFLDSYLLGGQPFVYVATGPFKGSTASLVATLKEDYAKDLGLDPVSERATQLGGQPAVRLAYEGKADSGQDAALVDDIISRNGTGWEVYIATTGGAEDVAMFDQFVATFAFLE